MHHPQIGQRHYKQLRFNQTAEATQLWLCYLHSIACQDPPFSDSGRSLSTPLLNCPFFMASSSGRPAQHFNNLLCSYLPYYRCTEWVVWVAISRINVTKVIIYWWRCCHSPSCLWLWHGRGINDWLGWYAMNGKRNNWVVLMRTKDRQARPGVRGEWRLENLSVRATSCFCWSPGRLNGWWRQRWTFTEWMASVDSLTKWNHLRGSRGGRIHIHLITLLSSASQVVLLLWFSTRRWLAELLI